MLGGCSTIQSNIQNEREEVNRISVGWKIELVSIDYHFEVATFALYLRIIDDTNRESLFFVAEYQGTFWAGSQIVNEFMPENTLLRGSSWFAGSGNNFYAMLVDGNIVIYQQLAGDRFFGFFEEVGRLYLGADIDVQVMEVLRVMD